MSESGYDRHTALLSLIGSSIAATLDEVFAFYVAGLDGKEYELGGSGPDVYDCSGVICYGIRMVIGGAFGEFTADHLYRNYTTETTNRSSGTLKFYDYNGDGRIQHVTTKIDSENMFHPSSGQGILQVVSLSWLDKYTEDRGGSIYYHQINWAATYQR